LQDLPKVEGKMTEYVRKSSREDLPHPVKVSFKPELMGQFYDLVGKGMKDIGAHLFGHILIKNYCQEGHTVSSFITNLDWQEKYWSHYWDCDPIHSISHSIVQAKGSSIISWKIVDPDSDCMEDRKTMSKAQDGVSFDIQHVNGIREGFGFGWEKYDVNRINREKLAKLCNMVTDFRIQHYRMSQDMFDTFPAVQFH